MIYKQNNRWIIDRRSKLLVLATPSLKQEYISRCNVDKSTLLSESEVVANQVELLKLLPHTPKYYRDKLYQFILKTKVLVELTNRGFKEDKIKEALNNCNPSIQSVKSYLLARGYKQAMFI